MDILNKYPMISNNTASRILDGEAVVILPLESYVYTFDPVGTQIWELINGKNKIANIVDAIQNEYEVDPDVAEQDTVDFINELVTKKILVLNDDNKS
jgi:hypothetical protein